MPNVQVSDDGRAGVAATSVRVRHPAHVGRRRQRRLRRRSGHGHAQDDPPEDHRAGVALHRRQVRHLLRRRAVVHVQRSRRARRSTSPSRSRPCNFDQENWDTPNEPAAWGVAGWTKGDRSVLLYDRFDIWELDPTGVRPAVDRHRLGRPSREHHVPPRRPRRVNDDDRAIDPAKPLTLRAFDEDTKASGFYTDKLGAKSRAREGRHGRRRVRRAAEGAQRGRLPRHEEHVRRLPEPLRGAEPNERSRRSRTRTRGRRTTTGSPPSW